MSGKCSLCSSLIFCSLEIPLIFGSHLTSAVRNLSSSCFCIVQHFDLYKKMCCIFALNYWLLILVFFVNFCLSVSCSECLLCATNFSWYCISLSRTVICIYWPWEQARQSGLKSEGVLDPGLKAEVVGPKGSTNGGIPEFLFNYAQILFLKSHHFGTCFHLIFLYTIGYN